MKSILKILAIFLAVVCIFFLIKERVIRSQLAEKIKYFDSNEKSHDELLANISGDLSSIKQLEKLFGRGHQYIRHYQVGFDDSVLVWEATYQEKFIVQYEIPLFRERDEWFVVDLQSEEIGFLLENIQTIKLSDGRIQTIHGNSREFSRNELLSWNSEEISTLLHDK